MPLLLTGTVCDGEPLARSHPATMEAGLRPWDTALLHPPWSPAASPVQRASPKSCRGAGAAPAWLLSRPCCPPPFLLPLPIPPRRRLWPDRGDGGVPAAAAGHLGHRRPQHPGGVRGAGHDLAGRCGVPGHRDAAGGVLAQALGGDQLPAQRGHHHPVPVGWGQLAGCAAVGSWGAGVLGCAGKHEPACRRRPRGLCWPCAAQRSMLSASGATQFACRAC